MNLTSVFVYLLLLLPLIVCIPAELAIAQGILIGWIVLAIFYAWRKSRKPDHEGNSQVTGDGSQGNEIRRLR
ncbi:MAG: hypothetical protein Q7J45_00630 [bacterium]|nr:hypothetical protein [bacterium]